MKEKIEGQYIASAGEFSVASELLFRGFNANIMTVDTGIDVVATKDNRTYLIQVKTSRFYERGNFHYDIRMKSLFKFSSGDVFYIFVLRYRDQSDYVILPANVVEQKIDENAIKTIEKYDKYRVKIQLIIENNEKKVYLGNKNHDITYYLNKWDTIK